MTYFFIACAPQIGPHLPLTDKNRPFADNYIHCLLQVTSHLLVFTAAARLLLVRGFTCQSFRFGLGLGFFMPRFCHAGKSTMSDKEGQL